MRRSARYKMLKCQPSFAFDKMESAIERAFYTKSAIDHMLHHKDTEYVERILKTCADSEEAPEGKELLQTLLHLTHRINLLDGVNLEENTLEKQTSRMFERLTSS